MAEATDPSWWPVGVPNDTFRKHCPFPSCTWHSDFTIYQPPQLLEDVIKEHLDYAHPGWTMDQLQALAQQRLELEMEALDIQASDGIGPDWDIDEWWRIHGQDPESPD